MNIPIISPELFTRFNDVKYYDEPHKYYVNGKQLTSVTTLIHKYTEEFEEEKWAKIKGDKYSVHPDDIIYAWKFINEKATTKGSIIHDYTENLFLNKVFPYPKKEVIDKFGYDAVWDEYQKTKKQVDDYYDLVKNVLIPIKTELVVYDDEYFIGGMVDMLFYNMKSKEFEIWDWKTNSADKAFNEDPDRNLKGKLYLLDDTDLDKYSLQLSAYKYIIEKNTSIKLGQSHIVWFSHKNTSYEIMKTKDHSNFVEIMFNDHLEKNN